MQAIINFLSGIANGITNIFDIAIKFVSDLVSIVMLLIKVPAYLADFMSWIPEELLSFILLLISIAAVYKITGRS